MPTPTWHLSLLGSIDLRGPDAAGAERVLVQPKHVALLAYLAMEGTGAAARRFHRRDHLIGLFWPELDQEHARASLRRVVHYVRAALGAEVLISRGDEELGADEQLVHTDVAAFTTAIANDRLAGALELYRGDLMPGFHLSECWTFQQWLDARRDELRREAGAAAWALAQTLERDGQLTSAGQWARRASQFTRDDERMVRRALTMLERLGDRAGAFQLFEDFSRWLRTEHNASPSAETVALVTRMRTA
jgi:serine/threonine-protein kinase